MSAEHLSFWQDLISMALVGTGRQSTIRLVPDGAFAELVGLLGGAAPEQAMLGIAAAVSLYRRAGHLPAGQFAPPAPSDYDDTPCCSGPANQHLAQLLRGQQRELLPEWLEMAVIAKVRVSDEHLPALLELGLARKDLRAEILPLLGKRGRWLASFNSEWDYAIGDLSALQADSLEKQREGWAALWQTGGRSARLALLTEVRRTLPAFGRELVQSTWAEEKADDRAAFTAALRTGLSMEDEPFLEGVLDDRGKDVRRAAADLLAQLPESRLVQRMVARVEPLLRWAPGRKPTIEVVLPEDCDKAMKRDGVEPRPPYPSVGERAWWLFQVLSATPPSMWSMRWNQTPAVLLDAAKRGEWEAVLIGGWAQGACHHGDADWAETIVQHWMEHADNSKAFLGSTTIFQDLLKVLPPARCDRLLLGLLGPRCVPLHRHPILHLLCQAQYPWSPELSRAVLKIVRQHIASWRDGYDYDLRGALMSEFPRFFATEVLTDATNGWPTNAKLWESWRDVIDTFLSVLQFRYEMRMALGQ